MIRTLLELNGDRVLRNRLNSLPKRSQGRVLRPALRAGAKVILPIAKANANKKSGAMARSIVVRKTKSIKRSADRGSNSTEGFSVFSSAKTLAKKRKQGGVFYVSFKEFGFNLGRRLRKAGGKFAGSMRIQRDRRKPVGANRQVPGTHFLRRAVDQGRSAALNAIRAVMRTKLDEEARRGV